MKTRMKRKYLYLIVLQGNYGYGWDDLMIWDIHKDELAFASSREHAMWYRQNEKQAVHRIIRRRELNK